MQKLLLLAAAGAAGTLARYGLGQFVHRWSTPTFPWGTLAVNLSGCFLAGLIWALFENRWPASGETRVIILIGFMGAFTTFSAYILETGHLARSDEWMAVAGNIALQNILGFAALFAGQALGRI